LGWLSYQLTGSPVLGAVAPLPRSEPRGALPPPAPAGAGRPAPGPARRPRALALATRSPVLLTGLTLTLVFARGAGGYWALVGLETLFGVLWALDFPARRTSIFTLVGPRRVANAVSLEPVSMQVAKIGGPVLAGVGLARLGPEACFGAIAVLYALGLLVSLGLPGRIGGPARGPRAGVLATLAEGARTA